MLPAEAAAERILLNGSIHRGGSRPPVQALAIRGERIVAAGSNEEIMALAGRGTELIDLRGQAVVPGFIDPHVHMPEAHRFDRELERAASLDDLLSGLARRIAARPAGEWAYVALSLNRPEWWPTRKMLDPISGDHPVFLNLSGHVYAANSLALRLAGVDRETPDPFGGRIDRDQSGEATGLLFDTARFNVLAAMPPEPELDLIERLWMAQEQLLRAGVTTAHDMIQDPRTVRAYQRLREQGRLRCRMGLLVRVYESRVPLKSLTDAGLMTGFGDDWLRVAGVKLSLDGQFPSRGALVSEPYAGHEHECGTLRIPAEEFRELVAQAHQAGLRVCVHAVGDGAQHMAVDAFERAAEGQSMAARRHRIEHYGNLQSSPEEQARLRRLGVIAVPNPTFLAARGHMVEPYLGRDRAQSVTNVRELAAAGVPLAVGSDWPGLGSVEPLKGVQALVTRRSDTGLALQPWDALTTGEALGLYTRANAYVDFSEDRKGSLDPGMLADLVVLSDDPLATARERVGETRVLATMVGGAFVHQGEGFAPASA